MASKPKGVHTFIDGTHFHEYLHRLLKYKTPFTLEVRNGVYTFYVEV